MHQYELMVILDPEIDERTVAPSLDKFLNVVRNDGGTIDNQPLGRALELTDGLDATFDGRRLHLLIIPDPSFGVPAGVIGVLPPALLLGIGLAVPLLVLARGHGGQSSDLT